MPIDLARTLKVDNFCHANMMTNSNNECNVSHPQNYSMDCYFRQYWRDTRLGFTGLKKNTQSQTIDQLSLNVKMLEKIWKPDTYFHNGLSSYLHTITRPNKLLRISEHGDITYSMRYWVNIIHCSDQHSKEINYEGFTLTLKLRPSFENVKSTIVLTFFLLYFSEIFFNYLL